MSSQIKLPRGWKDLSEGTVGITGARLFDPAIGFDQVGDIAVEAGKIVAVGKLPKGFTGTTIDGKGLVVTPGFFDMHVHFREPGYEHKEDVRSGCLAAAAGGFTGVACMPNTSPAIDTPGTVNLIKEKALGQPVEVHPVGATTKGRKGEGITEMAELTEVGVTAFSDDGSPVASADIMRRALEYSDMLGAVIIEHCEEPTLTAGGIMHEGAVSTALGLTGWPSIGEDIATQRNIMLADYTGARIHIAHLSTAVGLDLIRQAKARGVRVTTEVTPQHLSLDCSILESYNSDFKVNPPLRENEDIQSLIEGLADGTIDCIATDHAPHQEDEKEVELALAPFGMLGLETAFGVLNTLLVRTGRVGFSRIVDALTAKPREVMRLPQARLEVGAEANLSILDPEATWMVDREGMHSKSKNTPFHGWELTGKAVGVVNRGYFWCERAD